MIISKKNKVSTTLSSFSSGSLQTQIIEPVYQWAQSKDNVFIQVKFAHRFSSPGCLQVTEEVDITKNLISLNAFGVQAHQPIRFELEIPLFRPVNVNASYYNKETSSLSIKLGRLFFNLTKADATHDRYLWKQLSTSNSKVPIWWEMKATHNDTMEEYLKMLEDIDEKAEQDEYNNNKQKKKENEWPDDL